jgi:hypothetical protein
VASLLSFARRPAVERRLLVSAIGLLALTRIGLRVSSVSRVENTLARLPSAARAGSGRSASIDQVAWAVGRASRIVPRATCLPQALVARSLLERQGFPARVHIGVTREDGLLRAHAWTEADGRVVVGGVGAERYELLAELSHRGA